MVPGSTLHLLSLQTPNHQTRKPEGPTSSKQNERKKREKKPQTSTTNPPNHYHHHHSHLLPFFPPALTGSALLPPAIATGTPLYSSPFSAPQAAQSASILTVAQISPLEHACCIRAADGQKAAKTVLVWPQGWVWA
jgi:hypothetical protein